MDGEDSSEDLTYDDDNANMDSEEYSDDDELLESDDNSSTSSSSDDNDVPDEWVKDIINTTHTIDKCRLIIKTIRKSSILYNIIINLARSSKVKGGLVLDMRVRWNSTFIMLHRLIIYRKLLEKLYDQLISIDGISVKTT